MADYYTHFSCLLEIGDSSKVQKAVEIYKATNPLEDEDDWEACFGLEVQEETFLWIHDDGIGDVEAVISYVKHIAKELKLTGLWGFEFANTCSKPRLDGFGGGAHCINLSTQETVDWIDVSGWLESQIRPKT